MNSDNSEQRFSRAWESPPGGKKVFKSTRPVALYTHRLRTPTITCHPNLKSLLDPASDISTFDGGLCHCLPHFLHSQLCCHVRGCLMGLRLLHDAIMGAYALFSFRSLARCLRLPVNAVLQQQSGYQLFQAFTFLGFSNYGCSIGACYLFICAASPITHGLCILIVLRPSLFLGFRVPVSS